MQKYELLLILEAAMDDEKRNSLFEKIEKIFSASKAEVEKEDKWGIKKLQYPINYKNEGFYVLYDIKAPKNAYATIEKKLRLEDSIIRIVCTKK